jgi:ribosomal protein S12 methylthiotransferase
MFIPDSHCTYSTIPSIRGPLRSIPIPELVAEATALVGEGARELCLIAQDPTAYGMDLTGESQLIPLLDALEEVLPPDVWMRLLYIHPKRVDEVLLQRVASARNLVPYLDIPVQHVDSDMLESMNRGTTEEHVRWIFRRAREINPDFALRTTLMTGFPGEDRVRFEKLLDFVETYELDRVGAFAFCPEEGTPAESMDGQIPERDKEERLSELLEVQMEVSRGRQERFVGRVLKVLVEEEDPEEGLFFGRSFRDAPEVDGVVEIHGGKDLVPGEFVLVRILEVLEHDLIGEVEHE